MGSAVLLGEIVIKLVYIRQCPSQAVCFAQAGLCYLSLSRFLLLWSAVLIMYPTTLAVIALTFSSYILQPVFPDCTPPYLVTRMLSATCLRKTLSHP